MKLNKPKFIAQRVYCWSVYGSLGCNVHKYYSRSTARNIEYNQVMTKIFHDYSFEDFFKVRKYCRQHPDEFSFYWEKNDNDI